MNLSKYLLEKQLGGLGTSFWENLSRIFVYPLNFGEAAVHTQVVTLDGRLATSHYSPPPISDKWVIFKQFYVYEVWSFTLWTG